MPNLVEIGSREENNKMIKSLRSTNDVRRTTNDDGQTDNNSHSVDLKLVSLSNNSTKRSNRNCKSKCI